MLGNPVLIYFTNLESFTSLFQFGQLKVGMRWETRSNLIKLN